MGRALAFAVAVLVEVVVRRFTAESAVVCAVVAAHAVLRMVRREPRGASAWMDAAFAAVLVGVTGGPGSVWAPYAEITILGAGFGLGAAGGAVAGAVAALASAPAAVAHFGGRLGSPWEAGTWFVLLPIVGMAGGMAARLWRAGLPDGERAVAEANRVLGELYRLARAMPVGLEPGSAAFDALEEIRDRLGSPAAAFVVCEDGGCVVAGSYGLAAPERLDSAALDVLAGVDGIIATSSLDRSVARALGEHSCWLATPVRRGGEALGAVVAACADHGRHGRAFGILREIADGSAVGVENAALFGRVREMSVGEERARIARELHDGVAQALTHIRFELDVLARDPAGAPDGVRRDVARLSRVAERALGDVRSTVLGLRAAPAGGLARALRAYVADLQGTGRPRLSFAAHGRARLGPDVEAEVFRIAQEAVSNALRHSRASRVRVGLDAVGGGVRLSVEDDGDGIRRGSRARHGDGTGVGLVAMRERAESIGARLSVGARSGGGTAVILECPPEGVR